MLQVEYLQYVEISIFARIRCIAPKYDRILRGGSKIPHRCFIDPTYMGPVGQKKYFSHQIFSHSLQLNPTDSLYVDRRRDDYIHAKFRIFVR